MRSTVSCAKIAFNLKGGVHNDNNLGDIAFSSVANRRHQVIDSQDSRVASDLEVETPRFLRGFERECTAPAPIDFPGEAERVSPTIHPRRLPIFSGPFLLLNRAQSVDRIGRSSTGRGQRRCQKRHEQYGQGCCDVDEWVGSTHLEEE